MNRAKSQVGNKADILWDSECSRTEGEREKEVREKLREVGGG